jgi:fructose transport system permease protein
MLLTHLVVAKLAVDQGVPAFFALLLGAVVGIALGAFHGTLVAKVGLPPFIVTLGSFYIFGSLGLVWSKAQTISKEALGGEDSLLLWTGKGISFGSMRITTGVLVALAMYIVFAYILSNTAWGRHVYSVGDDAEAARLAGVRTNRVLLSVYIVAGLICAVAAWMLIGRIASASPQAGGTANLDSITAVVIGGTSLFGGRGLVIGTLIGALIVGVLRNGLTLSGVDVLWQDFAVGVMIIAAVAIDQWIRKVKA